MACILLALYFQRPHLKKITERNDFQWMLNFKTLSTIYSAR